MKQPDGEENLVDLEKKPSKLPSRSEVHNRKKKKTKFKVKYPIIRMLALLFILLPVVILSYKFNSNPEQIETTPVKRSANFESISYENKENKPQEKDEVVEPEPVKQEPETDPDPVPPVEEGRELEDENKEDTPNEEPEQVVVENNTQDTTEKTKQTEQKQEKPNDRYDVKYHKVQADENLYRISMKYYNSRNGEDLIKKWNNLDGNTVIEGQILQIPIKIN
ncbi:LysM peptidoglycan-binding domain-containing protein [Bacillus sinesaloumensis]|uniref:LysM peptidoglycan-binding domain-containing protein n=1 Tax=Litchfieldia sinesaloumensis TaxID=1926280 RepID=UPI000988357B|nr:LysM peptidoglycan-binding domain-containing protein [Bacillus sinesaloumensis]